MDQKKENDIIEGITRQEYKEGFVTEVSQEFIPKGLNEDIIRMISARKEEPEWLLEFRLDAFRRWQKMPMPRWGHLDMPEIDFQDIIYYAAPKKDSERPKEIDPALEETTGNQRRVRPKKRISSSPSQKPGTEIPKNARKRTI